MCEPARGFASKGKGLEGLRRDGHRTRGFGNAMWKSEGFLASSFGQSQLKQASVNRRGSLLALGIALDPLFVGI